MAPEVVALLVACLSTCTKPQVPSAVYHISQGQYVTQHPGDGKRRIRKLKVLVGYIASSRPAWDTGDPVSIKQKHIQKIFLMKGENFCLQNFLNKFLHSMKKSSKDPRLSSCGAHIKRTLPDIERLNYFTNIFLLLCL